MTTLYRPVLRCKAAEMRALNKMWRNPCQAATHVISPIFEPVLTKAKEASITKEFINLLDVVAHNLIQSWGYQQSCLIDTHLLPAHISSQSKIDPLVYLIEQCQTRYHLACTPVLYLATTAPKIKSLMKVNKSNSLAIRVKPGEIEDEQFAFNLDKILISSELPPTEIDLIIDYGRVGENDRYLVNLINNLPHSDSWKSLTVLGGSMPQDLIGLEINIHRFKRYEWLNWQNLVSSQGLKRNLCFGDYTIMSSNYIDYTQKEGIPNPSMSVRYTGKEHFCVMRGEALRRWEGGKQVRSGVGYEQFIGHAQILCMMPEEYFGKNFSEGDKKIYEISQQDKKPGNLCTWLEIGINHHLTLVSREVAGLPLPQSVTNC